MGRRDDILHAIPLTTRLNEGQSLSRMDSRTAFGFGYAANRRHSGRQVDLVLGKEEAFHACWNAGCLFLVASAGLDV